MTPFNSAPRQFSFYTRSKRGISEGDVVICNAGSLRVKKVMHIAVFNPVLKVDSQALNRLKHINQKMLQEANLSMIQRIGMPLIGGGTTLAYIVSSSLTTWINNIFF